MEIIRTQAEIGDRIRLMSVKASRNQQQLRTKHAQTRHEMVGHGRPKHRATGSNCERQVENLIIGTAFVKSAGR